MPMRLLLLFPLLLWFLVSFAQQKQASVWIYGRGSELNFNYDPILIRKVFSSSAIGAAGISDSNGNRLFHAGGDIIFDLRDSFLVNFYGFGPTFPEGARGGNIIIPHQTDLSVFHYFNVRTRNKPQLYWFKVDMRRNNGWGGLDTAATRTFPLPISYQLACMLHANGRDTWLISRPYQSDSLVAWLVQDTGIVKTVYTDLGTPAKKQNLEGHLVCQQWDSQLKSSPNSEMLLVPRKTLEFPFHELYRFNRETGVFYDRVYIRDTTKTGNQFFINGYSDGAFSPDSKLLYTATGTRRFEIYNGDGPGTFWQFSLENYDSLAIAQSRIMIGQLGRRYPNKPEKYSFVPRMQLAVDGKIYVSPGIFTDSLLSIIHCPDKRGGDCQLKFREIDLKSGNGSYFPTLNQTFVRNAGLFQVQANRRKLCVGDTLEMSGYGAGAERFTWTVNPPLPLSVKVDTLTWQKIATHTIPPGSYTFSCRAFSRCGDVFEKSITVQINPNPGPPVLAPPLRAGGGGAACLGDSVFVFVANPAPGTRYFWSTGQVSDTIVVKQSGKYALDSVANGFGCGIRVGDSVLVTIKNLPKPPPPLISGPSLVEICEGQTARLKVETQNAKVVWSNGVEGDSVVVGSGQYSVISESDEGCQSAASEPVTVVEVPTPTPVFVNIDSVLTRETLENQNYCVAGMPGSTFSFSVEGGTIVDSSEDCVTVNWTSVPPSWARGPALVVAERLAGLGCEGVAAQQFSYRPQIQIPTLITPNTDDRNDTFVIEDLEFYPNHHLQIFNRWGKKVLDTRHYQNDWKGEEGIYFYNLVVGGMEMKGWVQAIK